MRLLGLAIAAGLLHLALIQPNHPGAMTWGALRLFPLELPAILLLLVALPRAASRPVRVLVVALLMVIIVLKLADFAMFTAFNRSFNPVADWPLAIAGTRLLHGAFGWLALIAAVFAALLLFGVATWTLWWATGRWAALEPSRRLRPALAIAASLAAAYAFAEIGHTMRVWQLPGNPPGTAFTARVGVEKLLTAQKTVEDLRAFEIAAQQDRWTDRRPLLDRIDTDVLIIFVESYGRSSIDVPRYSSLHRTTLLRAQQALGDAGVAMRSGYLEAPTRGGQSWLSHATLANGLWIDGHVRHAAVLASGRQSLYHLASSAGFRTAAVMPGITLDWPEGLRMGFDTLLAAKDLGYQGQAFNWVTMPDQFTLAAMDRAFARSEGQIFAQVALISSHAPWVPVPELVPWETIGDGRVFDEMATSGDTPEAVWRDRERVRDQYRDSVDYALQSALEYAAKRADDPPLIVLLGDHQAAPFVAQSESAHVPIHLIGSRDLVSMTGDWGWTAGLVPAPDAPVWRMDAFRDRFLDAFSSSVVAQGSG